MDFELPSNEEAYGSPKCSLFLSVKYDKPDHTLQFLNSASLMVVDQHTIVNIITPSVSLEHKDSYDYCYYNKRDYRKSKINLNKSNMDFLDKALSRCIEKYNIEMVYVYGDNTIFHSLGSLKADEIKVLDIKTYSLVNFSKGYDKRLAKTISNQRNKPIGQTLIRRSDESILYFCNLIAKNYEIGFSPANNVLFTKEVFRPKTVEELNRINILTIKLFECGRILQEREGVKKEEFEALLMCMLLRQFYPEKYQFYYEKLSHPNPDVGIKVKPTTSTVAQSYNLEFFVDKCKMDDKYMVHLTKAVNTLLEEDIQKFSFVKYPHNMDHLEILRILSPINNKEI